MNRPPSSPQPAGGAPLSRAYRLRPVDLGEQTLSQIKVFLRFSSALGAKWELVSSGNEDARVEPASAGSGLRLRATHGPEVDILLTLPLQLEDFCRSLGVLEAALQSRPPADPVAPAADPSDSRGMTPPLLPSELRHQRFRLRRWPPTEVLVQHKYHPRLASFLSMKQPVSLVQLSALSNVALEQCERFLAQVWQLGLAEREGEVRSPRPAASSRARDHLGREAARPDGSHLQRLGVVQRLRQRLGLGVPA